MRQPHYLHVYTCTSDEVFCPAYYATFNVFLDTYIVIVWGSYMVVAPFETRLPLWPSIIDLTYDKM